MPINKFKTDKSTPKIMPKIETARRVFLLKK